MADATDSDSQNTSSSDSGRDWYVQKWKTLCDELGTTDPTEVLARVQAMKRELNRSQAPESDSDDEGLVTISEVEEVFREMNQKMEKLRDRNAALVERLEEEGDEMEGPFRELHQKTEQLLDSLDAATMDEARERIQKLNQRLEDLYREKEQLAQAGLSNAEEAIDELKQLREERDALLRERDRLQADRSRLEQEVNDSAEPEEARPAGEPDTSVLEAAVVIRDRIGVSTPAQAEAFVQIVDQLHEQVRARAATYDVAADDAPDDVVEMLHSIAVHLDALPPPEALPPPLAHALGVTSTSEAHALANTVRRVGNRVVEHYEDSVEFEDVQPESEDALTLFRTLEDRLRALSDTRQPEEGDALPAEAGDILGIRTVEDARELETLIADMSAQLDRLSKEHEKLEEADLKVDTALSMIENMEAQLADLYHGSGTTVNGTSDDASGRALLDDDLRAQVLNLSDVDPEQMDDVEQIVRTLLEEVDRGTADRLDAIEEVLGVSTREDAEALSRIARQMEEQLDTLSQEKEKLEELGLRTAADAVDMIESMEAQLVDLYDDKESLREIRGETVRERSTVQQLEVFFSEREKIQEALGVSSADAVIEMVESLTSQLDELYADRDAEVKAADGLDASTVEESSEPMSSDASDPDNADALTVNSMEHQLEALYREKETLLHHGLRNAREAVAQLQTKQKQIDALQRENHTYEERFEQLQTELGTASVPRIVELVQTLESDAGTSREDALDAVPGTTHGGEYGLDMDAVSPFLDDETLERLDDVDPAELDALDVGIVRLSDDGTVEYLNEAALQLPGLPSTEERTEIVGKNFFLELAPSTNNNLFYGRFQKGQRRGTMDARFPYTFTSPDEGPQSFAVHLHRKPDTHATWLLYRPT